MTITFKNENDIIVYALEKIICYARKHQYIFIAQGVWWIASIIGLADGLTTHIDNLRIRSEQNQALLKVKQTPSGIEIATVFQDQPDIDTEGIRVHPDRISQIDNKDSDDNEVDNSELESYRATSIIQSAKKFVSKSRKERQAFKKQKPCGLSRTRSGKIPAKPLTKKQRNQLQAIPKDTLSTYLVGRQ